MLIPNITLSTKQHEVRFKAFKRNSKIPKGQTEIVEDRQDHGQQNKTNPTKIRVSPGAPEG